MPWNWFDRPLPPDWPGGYWWHLLVFGLFIVAVTLTMVLLDIDIEKHHGQGDRNNEESEDQQMPPVPSRPVGRQRSVKPVPRHQRSTSPMTMSMLPRMTTTS